MFPTILDTSHIYLIITCHLSIKELWFNVPITTIFCPSPGFPTWTCPFVPVTRPMSSANKEAAFFTTSKSSGLTKISQDSPPAHKGKSTDDLGLSFIFGWAKTDNPQNRNKITNRYFILFTDFNTNI
ncbi:hypothetical protein [Phocaeicola sp.]|uniref:hypothetical protein n=1 Tax=Phocaeicola sp. TaxID=2773926 RepID=UPI003AB48E1F